MKGREPMKTFTFLLSDELFDTIKSQGRKNERKPGQEIRLALERLYSDGVTIQGDVESFNEFAPDLEVKDSKRQRINMAFEDENLGYLRVISRIEGVSITEYVNRLVAKDIKLRESTVNKAKQLLKN